MRQMSHRKEGGWDPLPKNPLQGVFPSEKKKKKKKRQPTYALVPRQ